MWLPDPLYRRVPTLYTAIAVAVLAVGVHSIVAWASAGIFLSSAILVSYLRAIQPKRLRKLANVCVAENRASKPARPRAAANDTDRERRDVDAEISRWAETGFANVVIERPGTAD